MHKQTIVDQIEVRPDNTIQLRLAKQVIDDDGQVMSSEWHRTAFPPGHDIDAQMALVNIHLGELKFPSVDTAGIDRIKAIAAAACAAS